MLALVLASITVRQQSLSGLYIQKYSEGKQIPQYSLAWCGWKQRKTGKAVFKGEGNHNSDSTSAYKKWLQALGNKERQTGSSPCKYCLHVRSEQLWIKKTGARFGAV